VGLRVAQDCDGHETVTGSDMKREYRQCWNVSAGMRRQRVDKGRSDTIMRTMGPSASSRALLYVGRESMDSLMLASEKWKRSDCVERLQTRLQRALRPCANLPRQTRSFLRTRSPEKAIST
jgi:hypothetical protein